MTIYLLWLNSQSLKCKENKSEQNPTLTLSTHEVYILFLFAFSLTDKMDDKKTEPYQFVTLLLERKCKRIVVASWWWFIAFWWLFDAWKMGETIENRTKNEAWKYNRKIVAWFGQTNDKLITVYMWNSIQLHNYDEPTDRFDNTLAIQFKFDHQHFPNGFAFVFSCCIQIDELLNRNRETDEYCYSGLSGTVLQGTSREKRRYAHTSSLYMTSIKS